MPNLANTFVDDITPAIYAYNQELSRISYNQFVFACKRCLSIYSKVIDDIEEEYNHLNNAVNTGQTIDDILKRLDQITTVLNQFNECQIVHTSTSFIPIVLKLERTMKSDVDTNAEKLKQNKKELELLKGIIANQEAGILIPKIQELNNRAKLLQDNIRNSWIQVVITNENVETLTLEQKSSIQGNSKQLTNPDNEDATPLSEFDAENLYLPQSGKNNYHDSPTSITPPPIIRKETEQNDTKTNKRRLNKSCNRSTTITQSTQGSKVPIIAITFIAITLATITIPAALIAHFVFQASLLTIGIISGIGACCLIFAAIIYYCNKPSKSLENSNAEDVVNQITV
ncbi:hypothetical protein wNo_00560 [Wolbachia endosymbiont of Drosophila simulans wNo]|uniref:TomO hydrophobic C-terminal domain-containing protein n=1 Tax=unclassified Wolbachia TaxID=2640676 RepID=UPI0002D253BB|nr:MULTISPECIES: hypothetical protein [unclassified Wolbachia]AGJ98516.1 hypothetical protein wNo_00560 [Wolbachia endosymbiont of Drosophila simulans wNo]QCB62670.1 hypothetical protein EJA99_03555 [Wolbachia endosymbiont of Drosophila mauritiana]QCB63717.1 hypothetical protein EJB00_03550 [Wolbachia endosymbiont of Drosophila mauritiana]QWE33015.1 Uncharacterized protein WwMa_00580 [Wolbachia endosymbiont of Drosophila simulans]TGB06369.1 hypothetical protein E5C28_03985 [Wolbachia endosymbi